MELRPLRSGRVSSSAPLLRRCPSTNSYPRRLVLLTLNDVSFPVDLLSFHDVPARPDLPTGRLYCEHGVARAPPTPRRDRRRACDDAESARPCPAAARRGARLRRPQGPLDLARQPCRTR